MNNHEAIKLSQRLKNSPKTAELSLTNLYRLLELATANNETSASRPPINEMETIQVTPPQYTEFFDSEIARLNKSIPDTSSGTGSNIAGKTCGSLWGCSTETDSARIRDVLLSDWGLETLQFRFN